MGNLVTQYHCERSLVLGNWQYSLEHNNLSAWHTEGIHAFVLHKIELPLILRHLCAHTVLLKIAHHGIGEILSHSFHHSRVCGIGRGLGCLHILLILLVAEAQHLFVAHEYVLLASGDGHCA